MKDTRPIDEQVRSLTYEQKQRILKVGKRERRIGGILLIVGILSLIPIFCHTFKVGSKKLRDLGPASMFTCGFIGLIGVGYTIYKKIKLPFYSRKRYNYLKKNIRNL